MLTFYVFFNGDQRSDTLLYSVVKLENNSKTIRFNSQALPLKIHGVPVAFFNLVSRVPFQFANVFLAIVENTYQNLL
jgi:hypothetical protein